VFNKEKFKERLQEVMDENNETVHTLSKRLGLSASTISRYLNGIMSPKLTTIEAIAIRYGLDPVWLAGADVDKYAHGEKGRKVPIIGSIRLNSEDLPLSDIGSSKVPIVGRIAAGVPTYAYEETNGYEFVPYGEDVDFCLQVKGDSMIGARIFDGDLVYVRKQPEVENGDIAAVIVNGEEATLKRVYKEGTRLILHAENPTIKDLVFNKKEMDQVRILGRVVAVKFKL